MTGVLTGIQIPAVGVDGTGRLADTEPVATGYLHYG